MHPSFYALIARNLSLNFTKLSGILNTEEGCIMPNIKPVSDLRNYGEVLRDVAVGQPVFLTKNGHGRYVGRASCRERV